MGSYLQIGLAALCLLFYGIGPAAAHNHCGAGHHGCPGCPGVDGRHGCAACTIDQPDAPASAGAFDPDTVTTVRGTVSAVTVVPARGVHGGGTHVTLRGEGGETEVHLGPTWFLEREALGLARGDSLEVTGSLVEAEGATFLVAREARKGAKVVRLRDQRGFPLWSPGAHRR
ncbi:MAG TPA: hypothetical protein VMX54_19380 [Vicinamibacteria bacterium]|nr:hypothetical protein [Vicinamibacteria bacterium]